MVEIKLDGSEGPFVTFRWNKEKGVRQLWPDNLQVLERLVEKLSYWTKGILIPRKSYVISGLGWEEETLIVKIFQDLLLQKDIPTEISRVPGSWGNGGYEIQIISISGIFSLVELLDLIPVYPKQTVLSKLKNKLISKNPMTGGFIIQEWDPVTKKVLDKSQILILADKKIFKPNNE